jgi:sec-independent protein translocase protein TatA
MFQVPARMASVAGRGGNEMPGGFIVEGLLQPTHLLFILLIVLILFGPGKLPELGKGLGKGIREFKDALRGAAEGTSEKRPEEKKPEEKKD